MIAERLRKAVLQAAIQGKLTQQLPEDWDARDLLAEITAEKKQLIREGKIKRQKPLPEIAEDEIPFEIPENWCWVRLGAVVGLNPRNKIDDDKEVSFIPMAFIQDGYGSNHDHEQRSWGQVKSGYTHFAENDIVVAKITPCFQNRKSAIVRGLANGYGAGTTELHVIRPLSEWLSNRYLLYLFKTEHFIHNGCLVMTGTAGQQRVGRDYFENLLVPLPPYAEQQRIVAKLEEILPQIDKLQAVEEELAKLQDEFPQKLKNSLLQAAIQGKLTEQLPEDGDARELLVEIEAEKKRLIKEAKIKKPKPLPAITQDEIPFDIPENWTWSRLGICLDVRDGTHDTPKYVSTGVPLLTSKNLSKGTLDFDNVKHISEEDAQLINERSQVDMSDILFAMIGSIGNPVLVKNTRDFCIKNVALFKPVNNTLEMRYVLYFLMLAQADMKVNASGAVQSFVSLTYLRGYLVPLPPLSEQQRIVAKLEELLPLCDVLDVQ